MRSALAPAVEWERAAELLSVETPAYVVDLGKLEDNAIQIAGLAERAGARLLIALKAFAAWPSFEVIRPHVVGAAASGLHEALLAREMGGEVHVYSPGYAEREMDAILELADHVVFNSLTQWQRFAPRVREHGKVQAGLRINPEHSEVKVALYDPCAPGSRLGARLAQLEGADLSGISGLHFHTLCELGSDALERTVAAVETRFAEQLGRVQWVNLGGGHFITKAGYDEARFVATVQGLKQRHELEVYMEPGAAFALDAGVLVAGVLDVIDGPIPVAVLDASATAHMPDVLEMPYRPRIIDAGEPREKAFTYRLGGPTCLAGDVIGDYSFDRPLAVGDKLVFCDMAQYSMVKNTTFNGVGLPDIVLRSRDGSLKVVRRFGYEDYKNRLG